MKCYYSGHCYGCYMGKHCISFLKCKKFKIYKHTWFPEFINGIPNLYSFQEHSVSSDWVTIALPVNSGTKRAKILERMELALLSHKRSYRCYLKAERTTGDHISWSNISLCLLIMIYKESSPGWGKSLRTISIHSFRYCMVTLLLPICSAFC